MLYIPKGQASFIIPLNINNVNILNTEQNSEGDIIITVESTEEGTHCRVCGQETHKLHGYGDWIYLRHLPILGQRVYIRLRPKRYKCSCLHNPTTTQVLDWYTPRSPHTKAYDEYLLLQLVNSTIADVSRKENVPYDAVRGSLERQVQQEVDWSEYQDLKVVGIDEIALTKGRKNFAAIISTQQDDGSVKVLAVLKDRLKPTVRAFFETIPARLRPTMKTVCTDMWKGYVNAVEEFAAAHKDVNLKVVIDRFHVAKHYRDGVDTLRKSERRRLKKELSEEEYESIKGLMWIVRKNYADLTPKELRKLKRLFALSPKLMLAYTLREELTAIFNQNLSREQAIDQLKQWIAKVKSSDLTCFNSFLKTLTNWLDKIANYFLDRLSSGFVEGLNNKIKTLKRRCYGLSIPGHLFQRLYLDLEGYRLFA